METEVTIYGHKAAVIEQEDGALTVQEFGHDQAEECNGEHKDFLTYLRAYREDWFRDTI